MVKHQDLTPDPGKAFAALTRKLEESSRQQTTVPAGVKDLGKTGDMVWGEGSTRRSVRELPSLVERLEQDLAAGVATSSKMNTVATTFPVSNAGGAAAAGYPEGALWTMVESGDEGLAEVGRYQVIDGAWHLVGLDASRLITGSIDAGLIDAVSLAAHLVSAKLIRTNATGQRVEMTSDGLVLWLIDDDGRQYQGVRIGPNGATLVTVGDVTIEPGSVTAPAGNFRALSVGGRSLSDTLLALPQGVAGFATATTPSAWDGTGLEIQRLQAEAVLLPDRRYSITVDAHYAELRQGSGATFVEFLRWESQGSVVTTSSTALTHSRTFLSTGGVAQSVVPLVGWIETSAEVFGAQPKRCYFALSTRSAGGRDARVTASADAPLRVTIRDEGPRRVATGRSWMEVGTPAEGSAQAPAAVAETKGYTSEWAATGTTTWFDSDNRTDTYTGSKAVVQGSYDGSLAWRRHGAWWFPDMTAALAGATITDVQIWVDNLSVFKPSDGGTGRFWAHNGTNNAVAYLTEEHFAAGQDLWIRVTSQHWAGFKNGSYKGFMALVTTNDPSAYMRFAAGSGSAKISISYTK